MRAFHHLVCGLVALLVSMSSSAQVSAAKQEQLASSQPQCVEKMAWQAASKGMKAGVYRVKDCKITCSGGSTSTTCRDNEKCHCECRSSGLPGCSCHPNTRQDDNAAEVRQLEADVVIARNGN